MFMNSLSPNSDEGEISLNIITTCSNVQVMRIKEVITMHGQDVLIFIQILLTSSIRNVWRTVRRICIFISGLKGLKTLLRYSP